MFLFDDRRSLSSSIEYRYNELFRQLDISSTLLIEDLIDLT
jgi:hypothetical protein